MFVIMKLWVDNISISKNYICDFNRFHMSDNTWLDKEHRPLRGKKKTTISYIQGKYDNNLFVVYIYQNWYAKCIAHCNFK